MSDEPETPPADTKPPPETKPLTEIKAETLPSGPGEISALASANAPIISFDTALFLGAITGIGQITLAATRYVKPDGFGGAISDRVLTAHIRGTLPALRTLKFAVDTTIKMLEDEQNRAIDFDQKMAILQAASEGELPN